MDQEMQDYLALKAALKGSIRSAQGRTSRRSLQGLAKAVVQPIQKHPFIAGEVAMGIVSGVGMLLFPALGVGILSGGQAFADFMIGSMAQQGMEPTQTTKGMLAMLETLKPLAGIATALSLIAVGLRIAFK